jgi:hypothetical protein
VFAAVRIGASYLSDNESGCDHAETDPAQTVIQSESARLRVNLANNVLTEFDPVVPVEESGAIIDQQQRKRRVEKV